MKDKAVYKTKWIIRKYADGKAFEMDIPFDTSVFEKNILLNEGITVLLRLLTGETATPFSNANAYIGVGSTATATVATQTGLLDASGEYMPMEVGYPTISGQSVAFRAIFGADNGNFAWQEFTVANGGSGTSDNLNRRVSDQGTKASGQTWTVDLEIAFS